MYPDAVWSLSAIVAALVQAAPVTPRADERLMRGVSLERAGDLDGAREQFDAAVREHPEEWRAPMLRGQLVFRLGDNASALADFDRVVALKPDQEPYLWQRGISQYYEGRYEECAEQFVLHRTVNPDDVENAVWHFLCVTKRDGVEAARAAILPVGPDSRDPMPEVYRLFQGDLAVADVMRAAGSSSSARFYGALYVGLYLEATGDLEAALPYLRQAASATVGGYMRDVARLHVARLPKATR